MQRLVGGGLLRVGSHGAEVTRLQEALVAAGASITPDGAFGPKTRSAVVALQQAAGLGADGVVGPKTWAALDSGVKLPPGKAGAGGAAGSPLMAEFLAKLALVKARLGKGGKGGTGGTGGTGGGAETPAAPPQVEPTPRYGLFDDIVDTVTDAASGAVTAVSDTASAVGSAVGGVVGGVVEGVASGVSGAVGKIDEAVSGVIDNVVGGVAAAGQAVGEKLEEVGQAVSGAVSSIAEGVGNLADDVRKALGPTIDKVLGILGGLDLGSLNDVGAAIAAMNKLLAGLDGDPADPASTTVGGATYDFKKSVSTPSDLSFSDATYNALLAKLAARTDEIGRALPAPTLTLNGKVNGDGLPDDTKVTSATLTVVENIAVPDWTNKDATTVETAQQNAWKSYAAGVAAHEDLHAADDDGIYKKAAGNLIGKTVTGAIAVLDAATAAGNTQGPVRDAANPAPRLGPAGTTKVP